MICLRTSAITTVFSRYSIGFLSVFLISCSAVGPTYQEYKPATPPRWYANLPHQGSTASLTNWWSQFDDPTISQLIAASNRESETLASALSRIEQSRAAAVAARARLQPQANLSAGVQRANNGPSSGGVVNSATVSADASWEIDLFGGNKHGSEAAQARLDSSAASWHSARVSLSAEVATQYINLRACEALLQGFDADVKSRAESNRLTQLKVKSGFTATAEGALSSASVADAQSRRDAQSAECNVIVKSLVALTAIDEPTLRAQLAPRTAKLPQPAAFAVSSVPAQLISQRPDVAAAERDLAAANADIGSAEAARYPRLSLLGSIGYLTTRLTGITTSSDTWSFGPALSLPLFDGGARAANVDAAKARYHEALSQYKSRVRNAIREVEQSLTLLNSATAREADAKQAADGYEAFLKATDARYRAGAGSLLELEDSRRAILNAQVSLLNVQRERVVQWISLYKSLGGGWSPQDAVESSITTSHTSSSLPSSR